MLIGPAFRFPKPWHRPTRPRPLGKCSRFAHRSFLTEPCKVLSKHRFGGATNSRQAMRTFTVRSPGKRSHFASGYLATKMATGWANQRSQQRRRWQALVGQEVEKSCCAVLRVDHEGGHDPRTYRSSQRRCSIVTGSAQTRWVTPDQCVTEVASKCVAAPRKFQVSRVRISPETRKLRSRSKLRPAISLCRAHGLACPQLRAFAGVRRGIGRGLFALSPWRWTERE